MSQKLDYYLAKAVKDGLVDTDKQFLVITEAGEKVFEEISKVCFKFIDESNDTKDFITSAARIMREKTGVNYSPMQLFKDIMLQTLGSGEVQLFVFMLHERDSNYEYLRKSLLDEKAGFGATPAKPAGLSVVKKGPKLDS